VESSGISPPASILYRIFIDPYESRPRTGWRLLLHLLLLGTFLLLFTVPFAMGAFLFSLLQPTAPLDVGLLSLTGALITFPATLLATWTARRFLDRRSFQSLGLGLDRRSLADLISGVLMAGLGMTIIYLSLRGLGYLHLQPAPPIGSPSMALRWIAAMILLSLASFQEELLFRGYYLQNLVEGLNRPLAIFLTSVVFGALHLANPGASLSAMMGTALAGALFAYAWFASGRLWLPAGLHIGWNIFEGIVFGFPVSGLDLPKILHPVIDGPTWITGGEFGPEAGLVLIPSLGALAVLIRIYGARLRRES